MGFVGALFLVGGVFTLLVSTDVATAVVGSGFFVGGAIIVVGIEIRNAIKGR